MEPISVPADALCCWEYLHNGCLLAGVTCRACELADVRELHNQAFNVTGELIVVRNGVSDDEARAWEAGRGYESEYFSTTVTYAAAMACRV